LRESLAQQPARQPAATPPLADNEGGEVGLDLAVGLQLDQTCDLSVLDGNQRGGSGRG
jgi:hypothetical protein